MILGEFNYLKIKLPNIANFYGSMTFFVVLRFGRDRAMLSLPKRGILDAFHKKCQRTIFIEKKLRFFSFAYKYVSFITYLMPNIKP